MADRVAAINDAMDAAVAALAAGDYAAALNQALAVQGLLSIMPKLSRSSGTGGGSQSVEWDQTAVDQFILRIRQQQAAGLGVQTQNLEFNRAATEAADV